VINKIKTMNYQVVNQLNETQISQLVELYKNEFWSKNRTYQGVVKMLAASAEMLNVVTKLYIFKYSSIIKGKNVNIS